MSYSCTTRHKAGRSPSGDTKIQEGLASHPQSVSMLHAVILRGMSGPQGSNGIHQHLTSVDDVRVGTDGVVKLLTKHAAALGPVSVGVSMLRGGITTDHAIAKNR